MQSLGALSSPFFRNCPVIVVAVFLSILREPAAEAQTRETANNPAERWIIQQVTAGLEADLTNEFTQVNDRRLGGRFLEDLLTGALPGVKPLRKGVQIIGAVVEHPIDLENALIPHDISLLNCQFQGNVSAGRAHFARTVSFDGSTFQGGVDFYGMKVEKDFFFQNVVFEGPVDFSLSSVAGIFAGNGAHFKSAEQEASFRLLKVGQIALLGGAVFEGRADFSEAEVTGNIEADCVQFMNEEYGGNFNGVKIGKSAFFRNACFEGPAYFGGVRVMGDFVADGAQFRSNKHQASFNGLKVGENAFFRNTIFEGPVDFVWAEATHALAADGAHFRYKDKPANFNGSRVGNASFTKAVFEGGVDFVLARSANNFEASETQFKGGSELTFIAMKIEHSVFLQKAVFAGPVNFAFAEIAANFDATEARFLHPEKAANFNAMKVEAMASIKKAFFAGPVDFVGAKIAEDFDASLAQFTNQTEEVRLGMKCGRRALFAGATFAGPVFFADGAFQFLDLTNAVWPKKAKALHLEGMNYQHIMAAPKERQSHAILLQLSGQSAYAADVYGSLEKFFARQGYPQDADEAFIRGKRREQKEQGQILGGIASWLLDQLLGYGRRPWKAGVFCLLIVGLGCFLFSPRKMELQNPKEAPRVYSRLWYSLDLFLPFVDLKADGVWKPRTDEPGLRHYVRVHILLGWILIPLVLAALTGLIK